MGMEGFVMFGTICFMYVLCSSQILSYQLSAVRGAVDCLNQDGQDYRIFRIRGRATGMSLVQKRKWGEDRRGDLAPTMLSEPRFSG